VSIFELPALAFDDGTDMLPARVLDMMRESA